MSALKFRIAKGKKEKMALSVLVIMVASAAYFHIFIRPLINDLGVIMPKVSVFKRDLVDARVLIAKKDAMEAEQKDLFKRKERYKRIFPAAEEIPRFLKSLSEMASGSGVKIIAIKPFGKNSFDLEPRKGQVYREFPIEIVAKSGYHQLGLFLQRLESGDRFMMIKDLSIKADQHSKRRHNVRLIASTFILFEK